MNDGKPIGPFLVQQIYCELTPSSRLAGKATLICPGMVGANQPLRDVPIEITIRANSKFEEFRSGGEFEIIIRPVSKAQP